MRKLLLIIVLANSYLNGYNQIIRGTIKDQLTGGIIDYASVYLNGTFVGMHTDKNGNFELDVSKYPSMPLTISALGYYSIYITDLDPNKSLLILLTPKLFELSEVVINARKISKERRTNLAIFKREFLGTTMNSNSCEILNEDAINFSYDSTNDTLNAYSLKPIIIENKALGYNLIYYLDNFKFSKKTNYLLLLGNCIFNEDLKMDKDQTQKYERRRKSSYLGSRMHFIKSLWGNYLAEDGFVVKDSNNKVLSPDKYLSQTEDSVTGIVNKYLCKQKTMVISYYTRRFASQIILNKDFVYFDHDGYFDPLGIIWEGEMSKQRIGDLLPFEY